MAIEELYTKGISDIVETEGNLPRFTKICQALQKRKLYTWNEIKSLVKEVTALKNNKPIKRHIEVFKKIGILEQRDDMYMLSSEGKSLLELIKDEILEEELTISEKIFYFRAFFNNALYQLYILLKTIDQKHNLTDPKEMIVDYFRNVIKSPLRIWQKDSLRRDIEIYESWGKLQRGIKNKFGCMKRWLMDLKLLESKELILTSIGKEVLEDLEKQGLVDIEERIFSIANIYIKSTGKVNYLPRFDYSKKIHKRLILDLFERAYTLFETQELGVSDAKSIRCFVCIKVLKKHNITLEENSFNNIINELARCGIIRSLMTGREGKLAYISGFSRF